MINLSYTKLIKQTQLFSNMDNTIINKRNITAFIFTFFLLSIVCLLVFNNTSDSDNNDNNPLEQDLVNYNDQVDQTYEKENSEKENEKNVTFEEVAQSLEGSNAVFEMSEIPKEWEPELTFCEEQADQANKSSPEPLNDSDYLRDKCLYEKSLAHQNKVFCYFMSNSKSQSSCLQAAALLTQDFELCKIIVDIDYKGECVTAFAGGLDDVSLCNYIHDASWKDKCTTLVVSKVK